jgi:BASS family bile acid:Na+ symporter
MGIDQIIRWLALVTLIEMMVAIGLSVTTNDVVLVARDWRLIARAGLANYVIVPAATVGLLLLFRAPALVAVGFLIPAVCPGAPYGPPLTGMAKGNAPQSVGLMVILAGSSAVLAPFLLGFLLPMIAGDEPLRVDALRMVQSLVVSQFLPLCVGLYLAQRHPRLAQRLRNPLARLSTLLNLALLSIILVVQFRMLSEIRVAAYFGMFALVATAFLAGWLLGGPRPENRKSLSITTSIRNVGVSLVLVTASFPATAAVTAATAFGLFQTLLMALVAFVWGRSAGSTEAVGV